MAIGAFPVWKAFLCWVTGLGGTPKRRVRNWVRSASLPLRGPSLRGWRRNTHRSLGWYQYKSLDLSFSWPILERPHASQRSPEVNTTHYIQHDTRRRIKLEKCLKDCIGISSLLHWLSMAFPWSAGDLQISTCLGVGRRRVEIAEGISWWTY